MKKSIDGRKLSCPQPVIKVKQALDEGGFEELEILVDNKAAVENITRFAENSGLTILSVTEESHISTIVINNLNNDGASMADLNESEQIIADSSGAFNIFINSSAIGSGDQKLGEKLMEAFIYSLTEMDKKPQYILFMNSGIKTTIAGSASLESLRALQLSGVELLVCGACLDYYGIKDKLAVGKISNMYEITSILSSAGNTVTVG